jgi:phage shock protein PspC (stress-responsive transcriptional regulator)
MANRHAAAKNQDMSEQSTSGPQTGTDKFFAVLRNLGIRRRTDDKWIAGVCSGLADRMGIDPVIVRAGLVLLSLLGAAGITIYLVAWVLIPNERGEIVAQRALREADTGSIVLIVFAALALFGGSAFGGPWWSSHPGWGFPWGVALTGLLIFWLVKRSGNPDADQRVRAQQFGTPAAPGATPSAGGPTVPHTQGWAPTQALPQGQATYQTRVAPQTQAGPQSYQIPQGQSVPKRPGRRSGGPLMALLAIGLALATYGSLIWAGSTFSWTGSHAAIAFAGSLAAIGLLLVVLGFAGWRAGFVSFLAVVLALSAWASALVPTGIQVSGRVGDAAWRPTTVAAGTNYHLGLGDGVLDLNGLPTQGLSEAKIPVSVGMGDLRVLVPPGLTVKVVGHVGLGEILLPGDARNSGQGGSDVSRSIVLGDGPTEVVVNAGVGIGQLTVVKE